MIFERLPYYGEHGYLGWTLSCRVETDYLLRTLCGTEPASLCSGEVPSEFERPFTFDSNPGARMSYNNLLRSTLKCRFFLSPAFFL